MNLLDYVLPFVVALGVLIIVHEFGHYIVARLCGVKVLRFSIGFGRPLLRWQPKGSPTEFVLGALPLGGYVRMLEEEATLEAESRLRNLEEFVSAAAEAEDRLAALCPGMEFANGYVHGRPGHLFVEAGD